MAHKIVETTLAAALAASGTVAVGYPTGTNAGSYQNGKRHKLVTGTGDVYSAPKHFTLTFGASTVTVTWGSSQSTLPIGTVVYLQLDMAGSSPQGTNEARDPALKNTAGSELKVINWGAVATADADGISASQTVTGAGTAFLINGALASSSVVTFDVPRNVVAAWTNTAVLTITGKDEYGNSMVETSASGTSHTGKKAFKKVTSVTTSATVTSATVGSGNKLGLPVFASGVANVVAELKNGAILRGFNSDVVLQGIQTEANVDAGTSLYLVSPCAGAIKTLHTVQQGTVTTGGDVTLKIATVAVTGLTCTVANSAAAGEVDSGTATEGHASTAVAAGDAIEIVFPAAFNASADVHCAITIRPTVTLDGTLVAGLLTSAQSGTTDDVRGTYTPSLVPDGSTVHGLLVQVSDPDFLGGDQYAG